MNVINEKVIEYINGLYRPQNQFLDNLRKSAEENHIPIILKDAETLILNLIKIKKPMRILEVGTAVGYSSICFVTASEDTSVISLEIKEDMYRIAVNNVDQAGLSDKIQIILGDAVESLNKLTESIEDRNKDGFDMVFIDASKGHYREFWEGSKKLCKTGAIIISDNVLLKGRTASNEYITQRRQKTSVRRMREYLQYITNIECADTAVLPVGDGVAVSVLRG